MLGVSKRVLTQKSRLELEAFREIVVITLVDNTGVQLDCHWCADNLAEEARRVAGIVCWGGVVGAVGSRGRHPVGFYCVERVECVFGLCFVK